MSDLLLPAPDEDSAPFWEGCARGELLVQACGSCGTLRFPPRPMCPACQGTDVAWMRSSGRGTVWSFVVVHPPVLPAYAERTPYPVVVVQLDEADDLRMVGAIDADPDELEIGLPVEVGFERVGGVTLPRWTLSGRSTEKPAPAGASR